MNLLIARAIEERRLLMFGYGDLVRVVEPHLYGVTTTGREALSAWMRPGLSRSDPQGGWRMFRAEELRDVQLLPDRFEGPREGFNPDDRNFVRVYRRLVGAGRAASGASGNAADREGEGSRF